MNWARISNLIKEPSAFVVILMILSASFFISGCRKTDTSANNSADTNTSEKVEVSADNNEKNTAPIQVRLADAMVAGSRYHGVSIKADRFDPVSGFIYGVRVTAKGYLLSADHAEIVVNYSNKTARLILYDAVSATFPTYSEIKFTGKDEGEMTPHYKRLELEPFSIKD